MILDNQFLQGGLVLGAISGALYYFKNILFFILNRFRRKYTHSIVITDNITVRRINMFLMHKYKHLIHNTDMELFYSDMSPGNDWNENRQRKYYLEEKLASDTIYIKFNWYTYLTITSEKVKGESHYGVTYSFPMTFSIMFNKKLIYDFVQEAINYGVQEEHMRQQKERLQDIKVYDSVNGWTFHKKITSGGRVVINDKVYNSIIQDIETWIQRKDFYLRRGITYKRGYLLYGPPGNGKTSLILDLAKKYNRDIYYIDLAKMTNDTIVEALKECSSGFLVIEDIDRVFDKDKPINADCKLDFSKLLNVLGGILDKDNMLLFITANHYERLDEALIRPGRIDKKYHLRKPCQEDVEKYIQFFYDNQIDESIRIPDIQKLDLSYADLQQRCFLHENYKELINELNRELDLTKND